MCFLDFKLLFDVADFNQNHIKTPAGWLDSTIIPMFVNTTSGYAAMFRACLVALTFLKLSRHVGFIWKYEKYNMKSLMLCADLNFSMHNLLILGLAMMIFAREAIDVHSLNQMVIYQGTYYSVLFFVVKRSAILWYIVDVNPNDILLH